MPVDLREIASIAGMSGLFRIISPTRNGVVVETIADSPVRSVAQAKHRLSLLHEISIYTNDPEVTAPLSEIFDNIRVRHGQEVPVNAKSSNPELLNFMETILPDYDRERVYVSDIKKIVNWFGIVSKYLAFEEAEAADLKGEAVAKEKAEDPEKENKAGNKKIKSTASNTQTSEKPAKTKKEASAEPPVKEAKKDKKPETADKTKAAANKTKKSAE